MVATHLEVGELRAWWRWKQYCMGLIDDISRVKDISGCIAAEATYGSRVAREYEWVAHGAVHTYVISRLKASDQGTARWKTH